MTIERATRLIICFLLLGLLLHAEPEIAQSEGKTKVSKSGSTVLGAMSPKGKVEVTIQTTTIEGSCLKASAAASSMMDSGANEASVVQRLTISIAGKSIAVPPAVYSGLFNVMWASISYKNGSFDLVMTEGVDLYSVHIYFGPRDGVTRVTVYDHVAAKLVEDARFYQSVID